MRGLAQAVVPQGDHALHHGDLLDVLGRAALDDQALDLLGHEHDLVDARIGPGSRCGRTTRSRRPGAAWAIRPASRSSVGQPASTSSASVGWYGSLHLSQSRRASRWATTQSSALVTRNGSTPISTSRIGVDAASLVCRVESTR